MKKFILAAVAGMLLVLPACVTTSTKSPEMRKAMKRQAEYLRARAEALDRQAAEYRKVAKETLEKAEDKHRQAEQCRKQAEMLERGESPLSLLPPE